MIEQIARWGVTQLNRFIPRPPTLAEQGRGLALEYGSPDCGVLYVCYGSGTIRVELSDVKQQTPGMWIYDGIEQADRDKHFLRGWMAGINEGDRIGR